MAQTPIIEVKTSGGVRKLMLTGEPVTIGRDEANSLAYRDARLSKFHCVIEKKDNGFRVRDLGSRTGIVVNGKRVSAAFLAAGDVVQVGPVEIRFALIERSSAANRASGSGTAMAIPALAGDEEATWIRNREEEEEVVAPPLPPPLRAPHREEQTQGRESLGVGREPPDVGQPLPEFDDVPAAPEAAAPVESRDYQLPELPLAEATDPATSNPQASLRRAPQFRPSGTQLPAQAAAARPDIHDPLHPATAEDARNIIAAAIDHDQRLRQMIQSLPRQPFDETKIGLVNARGQTVHAPTTEDVRAAVKSGRDSVLFLRQLIMLCLTIRATDLHIEPKSGEYQVRVRVDGMMVSVLSMNATIAVRLLRLVKILCEMDIVQSAAVQDGHFCTDVPGRRVDYRISFTPAMYGQKLVVRVLDQATAPGYMKDLTLPPWMAKEIGQVIHQEAGMVLMCGPTGSGKTTTLYALIREIDTSTRNVITIEDPVEYQVEGVTQMPINEAKGNTFSTLLRSVLRQDPDVILVGEIRDPETARIAMQAAVTGHLVFSTVHAQDTIGTVFRLMNLGVEPYLVASALHLVLAQRLVRLLCPHCKRPDRLSPGQMMRLGRFGVDNLTTAYAPIGCPRCLNTGYFSRRAIFELLTANDELRDVILAGSQIQEMRKSMRNTLFTSLQRSGYQLVAEGVTSIDEIERVVGAVEV